MATLEQLSAHEWRLELELEPAALDAAVARRLLEMRPRAEAPGFRRGKAPLPVLQRTYGAGVRRQQWQRLAQSELRRELAERGLRPAGPPRLEAAGASGAIATFELFPSLPPLDLAALEIEKPVVEIGEADVGYMLERLPGMEGAGEERRQELRRAMEEEAPEAAFEEAALAVEAALLAAHPDLDLPPGLLAAQVAELRQGDSPPEAELEARARRRLGGVLLLAEAARQEGVRVEPAELWQETKALASQARDRQEELDRLWGDGAAIQEIEERLLRRKAVAAVLAKAKVREVATSFADLARKRREREENTAYRNKSV
jgi:FKBP-type peptidyl-prolyl cis-trans isomerase (trigger factor)